jgi:hypothetical protein
MGSKLSVLRPELQLGSSIPSFLSPQAAALSHEAYLLCVSFPHAVDPADIDVHDRKEVGTCAEQFPA